MTIVANSELPTKKHSNEEQKTLADLDSKHFIDFDTESPTAALSHCITACITAENPDEGFQPTSGNVTELTFCNTPNVWGYFSIMLL